MVGRATRVAALALVVGVGAATSPRNGIDAPRSQGPSSRPVRVLLAAPRDEAPIRAAVAWRLVDRQLRVIARGQPGDDWIVQREATRLRGVGPSGASTPWYEGPATLELSDTAAATTWNAKHYRGRVVYIPADTALLVVNRLDVEDYLRGVVPLEVGTKSADDHAAVEAQAVAARSFTYTRMLYAAQRDYDLTASTNDQVYGGTDVEGFIGDLAVAATAGWVLSFDGRVIAAPYHSTCGGQTAAPSEIWRESNQPYLRGVSDRIPGTDRYYCDIAPRFRWQRTLSGEQLTAAVQRYAGTYAPMPAGPLGAVREVRVDGITPSGRVEALAIVTERARLRLAGNDVRYVLRTVGGEILPSTYFSVEPLRGAGGQLVQLSVRGRGYGHGVGMCQWGAIGRARAGQDFRAILRAYYPGAQLVRAP